MVHAVLDTIPAVLQLLQVDPVPFTPPQSPPAKPAKTVVVVVVVPEPVVPRITFEAPLIEVMTGPAANEFWLIRRLNITRRNPILIWDHDLGLMSKMRSAIWMPFKAAPLRKLSETIHRIQVFGSSRS